MADVTRRRTGELLRGLFEILMEHPDGIKAAQALDLLEKKVPATPWETGNFDSGGRRFEKIVRWGTVDCVKAEWMVKAHGNWTITDEGRKAYKDLADPEAFYKRAVYLYAQWRKLTTPKDPPAGIAVPIDSSEDEKGASITFEEAEEQAWAEIERHVTTMPPYEFQKLVGALLEGMGYHVGWIAPPGKDGGVDIMAFNDPLGTRPPRIKVQVKRQQAKVSVDGLRAFMALLGNDDVGIFVNTGGFTSDAETEARFQPSRKVTLLDLTKLVDLWTEHYEKIEEASRRRLPLVPIYFLAPED